MDFTRDDDIWRDTLAARISALDHGNPLLITRLDHLRIYMPFSHCDDHFATNNAHYKAHLVEVIDIRFDNTIFGDYVLYKIKPGLDDSWIFAFGSLIIKPSKRARIKLWLSLNEVRSPSRSDAWRVAVGE